MDSIENIITCLINSLPSSQLMRIISLFCVTSKKMEMLAFHLEIFSCSEGKVEETCKKLSTKSYKSSLSSKNFWWREISFRLFSASSDSEASLKHPHKLISRNLCWNLKHLMSGINWERRAFIYVSIRCRQITDKRYLNRAKGCNCQAMFVWISNLIMRTSHTLCFPLSLYDAVS